MRGFHEAPARTVSSSSGLRRARDVPRMRKYTSACTRERSRAHSYACLSVYVCLHAPVTIYVHLERRAHIDRNDAPGTRVITNRFCNGLAT